MTLSNCIFIPFSQEHSKIKVLRRIRDRINSAERFHTNIKYFTFLSLSTDPQIVVWLFYNRRVYIHMQSFTRAAVAPRHAGSIVHGTRSKFSIGETFFPEREERS